LSFVATIKKERKRAARVTLESESEGAAQIGEQRERMESRRRKKTVIEANLSDACFNKKLRNIRTTRSRSKKPALNRSEFILVKGSHKASIGRNVRQNPET